MITNLLNEMRNKVKETSISFLDTFLAQNHLEQTFVETNHVSFLNENAELGFADDNKMHSNVTLKILAPEISQKNQLIRHKF